MKAHGLNGFHRIVWSTARNAWVVVAEICRSRGKAATGSPARARTASALRRLALAGCLGAALPAAFAADPPPPPPQPGKTSVVDDVVRNPLTGLDVTVTELVLDPAGTPTAGSVAYVRTSDGYVFVVKEVGELLYGPGASPQALTILARDAAANAVTLTFEPQAPTPRTATLEIVQPWVELQAEFSGGGDTGSTDVDPVDVVTSGGIQVVLRGSNGGTGRTGALFVPPGDGGHGGPAGDLTRTFAGIDVDANNRIGLEVGTVGGSGGKGGDAWFSFWNGGKGGNGGAAGTVNVMLDGDVTVTLSGGAKDLPGVFAFSQSGQAGAGGDANAAPGGGVGGGTSVGGAVNFTNRGRIVTHGQGATGLSALSVSGTGGGGGGQWGLGGQAGSGGAAGNGGPVVVLNVGERDGLGRYTGGIVDTDGDFAHGILAQSVGGSGGWSGSSGNLFVTLGSSGAGGGTGGTVSVSNSGLVRTRGDFARGIFAQSVGGGGGGGGGTWGPGRARRHRPERRQRRRRQRHAGRRRAHRDRLPRPRRHVAGAPGHRLRRHLRAVHRRQRRQLVERQRSRRHRRHRGQRRRRRQGHRHQRRQHRHARRPCTRHR
ncbi:outer membrane autotransporter, partial [Rubrivivax benzoatilyticus JA2 = ATCC BAA-35]|uniref:ESPR domain-containing protein n=1 Tax=Rubrivivax benzoatilyticus TaxID=316997 RepID=UPI00020A3F23